MNEVTMTTRILGLSGSLRERSYNTALLRAVASALPENADLTVYDYRDVPFYNEDLDGSGPPDAVVRLRQAIQGADGLILATPEYNHGIPGVRPSDDLSKVGPLRGVAGMLGRLTRKKKESA